MEKNIKQKQNIRLLSSALATSDDSDRTTIGFTRFVTALKTKRKKKNKIHSNIQNGLESTWKFQMHLPFVNVNPLRKLVDILRSNDAIEKLCS